MLKNNLIEKLCVLLAILVPLQIYFKVYGTINTTIAFLLAGVLFIIFVSKLKFHLKNKTYLFYIALCLLFTIRILWGGEVRNGVKIAFFMWMGPVTFFAVKNLSINLKKKLLIIVIYFSIPVMFLSIGQALSESFKMYVLNSPVMSIFIEPDTLKGLIEGYAGNNILIPGRGGGFFVNVNVGSIYFNFVLLLLIYLIFNKKKVSGMDSVLLVLTIMAVFSTASTAGVAAMVLILFVSALVVVLKKRTISFPVKEIIISLVFVSILLFGLSNAFRKMEIRYLSNEKTVNELVVHEEQKKQPPKPFFLTRVIITSVNRIRTRFSGDLTSGRREIWRDSFETLKKKWLFGYGYSIREWEAAHKGKIYTPHNIFLMTWVYVGIAGPILLFCFMVFYLLTVFKNMKTFGFKPEYFLGFLVIIILFLQGFTENLVFGAPRVNMLFWLILGVLE